MYHNMHASSPGQQGCEWCLVDGVGSMFALFVGSSFWCAGRCLREGMGGKRVDTFISLRFGDPE